MQIFCLFSFKTNLGTVTDWDQNFFLFFSCDLQVCRLISLTDYRKTMPERMTCHIRVGQFFTDRDVQTLNCPCMSLLCCFAAFPFADIANRCRLAYGAAGGAVWGEGGEGGGKGKERVRDFRMAANTKAERVMRKCQTCIQPIIKGAPPCAGCHAMTERDGGREKKKKGEISI